MASGKNFIVFVCVCLSCHRIQLPYTLSGRLALVVQKAGISRSLSDNFLFFARDANFQYYVQSYFFSSFFMLLVPCRLEHVSLHQGDQLVRDQFSKLVNKHLPRYVRM